MIGFSTASLPLVLTALAIYMFTDFLYNYVVYSRYSVLPKYKNNF